MRPIRIDFAPRTFRRAVALAHPTIRIAGVVVVVACTGAGLRAYELAQERDTVAVELRTVQGQLAKKQRKPEAKRFVLPEAQANAVNGAVAQLNLPWRDVFDAVEAATPTSIALLALDPDANKRILKGTAEAKTSDAMIAYIEQLKQQAFFEAVVLTRHEVNDRDSNRPFRFQFEAQWTMDLP